MSAPVARRRSRFLSFAVVLVLAGVACALVGLGALKEAESVHEYTGSLKPRQVLFIGDSITEGVGSGPGRSFVMQSMKSVGKRFPEVGSESVFVGGGRAVDIDPLVASPSQSVARQIVVVEVGTNDVGRTKAGEFSQSFAALLRRVAVDPERGRLVCLGAWGLPRSTIAIDDSIRTECVALGGVFVPVSDLYLVSRLRGPADGGLRPEDDNFHPNDLGHAAIGARVAEAIVGE